MNTTPNVCVDCGTLCSPRAVRCRSCAGRERLARPSVRDAVTLARVSSATWREKITTGRVGKRNPYWKGGSFTNKQGYVWVLLPDHPSANANGYVQRSHLVAEKKVGRSLLPGEVVHHRNRVRSDDRPKNLEVLDGREHIVTEHLSDRRLSYARRSSWDSHGGACSLCNTTNYPHAAGGMCKRCYRRVNYRKHRGLEGTGRLYDT